jgi:hypothetical protein
MYFACWSAFLPWVGLPLRCCDRFAVLHGFGQRAWHLCPHCKKPCQRYRAAQYRHNSEEKEAMSVDTELDSATRLGIELEDLIVRRGKCPDDDRNILLMGYWALICDYHKGILSLIPNGFFGSAFALVRPVMEVLVRAHVVVKGSEAEIKSLQQDTYRTNFTTIGAWIDSEFQLGNLLTNLLTQASKTLHSYTHGGVSQLGRRFDGNDLKANYTDGEIIEVIRSCTSAVWMVTNLVTKYLRFDEEAAKADALLAAWGNH